MKKKTTTTHTLSIKEIVSYLNIKGNIVSCGFNLHQIFFCPKCEGELIKEGKELTCEKCNKTYYSNNQEIINQKEITIKTESKKK
jgi:Zn finger protein HypA/HybF involved in hydrogenase expression